jgi:hypothetical protein
MTSASLSVEKIFPSLHLEYNPIYKVNHLVNGIIDSVYVFYGETIVKKNEEEILQLGRVYGTKRNQVTKKT